MKLLLTIIISVVVLFNCSTSINFDKQFNQKGNSKAVASEIYTTDEEDDIGTRS